MSFAAAATRRVRLQTNLFVPAYRHPLLSAKAVATLDVLSGGRVVLGVGAGYLEGEFAALGADFERRNDVLDDALVAMKAAWSGEPVDGVVCQPTPVQRPHPPIWVGGNSKRAIRRAVALGDGWVPMPSPRAAAKALHTPGIEGLDDLRSRVALLHEVAAESGRTTPLDIVFMPSGPITLGRMADVTRLLDAAAAGNLQAAADLLPLVYGELRKLAAVRMAAASVSDLPGIPRSPRVR